MVLLLLLLLLLFETAVWFPAPEMAVMDDGSIDVEISASAVGAANVLLMLLLLLLLLVDAAAAAVAKTAGETAIKNVRKSVPHIVFPIVLQSFTSAGGIRFRTSKV